MACRITSSLLFRSSSSSSFPFSIYLDRVSLSSAIITGNQSSLIIVKSHHDHNFFLLYLLTQPRYVAAIQLM